MNDCRIFCRHGDMIYLVAERTFHKSIITKSDSSSSHLDLLDNLNQTKDDEVDVQLDRID